jgi:hypothetical protein
MFVTHKIKPTIPTPQVQTSPATLQTRQKNPKSPKRAINSTKQTSHPRFNLKTPPPRRDSCRGREAKRERGRGRERRVWRIAGGASRMVEGERGAVKKGRGNGIREYL